MHPPESDAPLHPRIAPYACTQVAVGDGHSLYIEQCGNAGGMPMVYLHGGPGSSCSPRHRQFFNPALCRAVLFDQRGCGQSLPRGSTRGNHTDALVSDMETVRCHLGIARWLVVGGSWGAGLALAYASAHPGACLGLVLRGVFLGRSADVNWFFGGAAQHLPDAWQQLQDQAPSNNHGAVLSWLHAGLHGDCSARSLTCALAWESWEQSLAQQHAVAPRRLTLQDADAALLVDKYRIQSHYLIHQCFRGGTGLLPNPSALSALPTAILHGQQDWICQAQSAWDLHRSLPDSRLQWVPDCGHNPFEPANAAALVTCIQHFATYGNFSHWGTALHRSPVL